MIGKADIPDEFKRLVEAMHWAKCFLQAAEMEDDILFSQATDWFARAMAAAREDEREAIEQEMNEQN